jgi:hypothetical protein
MTQVCLLTSWIRTGFWVTQRGQQQLHIELEKGDRTGIVHALSSELILSVKLLDSKASGLLTMQHSQKLVLLQAPF